MDINEPIFTQAEVLKVTRISAKTLQNWIDPSRGSRLVADMVNSGVLRRGASQEDGRRSVIEMTDLGTRLLGEMRSIKDGIIRETLAGWSEEEIAVFARLYDRFVMSFEAALSANARRGNICRSAARNDEG